MANYEERLSQALAKLAIQAKTCKVAEKAHTDIVIAYQNIWTCDEEEGTEDYEYYVLCSVMGFIDQEELGNEPYYRDIVAALKLPAWGI